MEHSSTFLWSGSTLFFLQETAQNFADHVQIQFSVSPTCFLSTLSFYYCVFIAYYIFHIVLCFQPMAVSLWSVMTGCLLMLSPEQVNSKIQYIVSLFQMFVRKLSPMGPNILIKLHNVLT